MQCEATYLRWGIPPSIAQAGYTLCERALELDSRNVRALAVLAVRSQSRITNLVSLDPKSDLRIADDYSARALSLDPNNYLAHYARAFFLRTSVRTKQSRRLSGRSRSIRASCRPISRFWGAAFSAGHPEKADEYVETALRLGPRDPYLNTYS